MYAYALSRATNSAPKICRRASPYLLKVHPNFGASHVLALVLRMLRLIGVPILFWTAWGEPPCSGPTQQASTLAANLERRAYILHGNFNFVVAHHTCQQHTWILIAFSLHDCSNKLVVIKFLDAEARLTLFANTIWKSDNALGCSVCGLVHLRVLLLLFSLCLDERSGPRHAMTT